MPRAFAYAVLAFALVGCGDDKTMSKNDMGMDDLAGVEVDLAGQPEDGGALMDGGGGLDGPSCATACSLGAKSCDGNGVRSCVQSGACTEWSTTVPCGGGGVCSGGTCVATCKNQCEQGATYCSQVGFRTCSVAVGGCTDWSSTVTPCTNGAVCSGGVCSDKCVDRCSAGQSQCSGFGVQSCERKFSGCLDWSDPRPCESGKLCSAGACVAMCTDVCTVGDKKCAGTDQIQECKKQAASGCNDFVLPQLCASGGACSAGACQTCTEMSKRCSPQGNVEQCTSGSFVQIASCAFGCTTGACTSMVSCMPGAARCNGNNVEICNSTGTAFLFSTTCANGCATGLCTGACAEGTKRCNGKTPEICTTGAFVPGTPCTTFCEDGVCALDSLTVSSAQDLNGLVLVAGAVNVSGAGVITSTTGDLTIRADSITINDGATITISPTGDTPDGKGSAGTTATGFFGAGGGGYGSQGNTLGNPGGPVWGSSLDSTVAKGSSGGDSNTAVKGGKGGGVLRLIAKSGIMMGGAIQVKGENATNTGSAKPGGGSGGGVLIAGNTVTVTGTINAGGGMGTSSGSADGGSGGFGRIKILAGTMPTVNDAGINGGMSTGVTKGIAPPLRVASSTHPSSLLIYNNGAPALGFAWERPFTGAQGYYQLLNTIVATGTSMLPNPSNTTGLVRNDLISLNPTSLASGKNLFHITSVNASSEFGLVENTFIINVNINPPNLSSTSHGSQTTFSSNHDVFFQWTSPAPDANFSRYYYVLDAFGETVPNGSSTPLPISQKQQIFTQPDGIWAFHIITADTQGYFTKSQSGDPSDAAKHYSVRIGPNPSPAPGIGTVTGTVTEMNAGGNVVPVSGATVTINRGLLNLGGASTDQTTAGDGTYTFSNNVPANFPASQPQWEVRATKNGYAAGVTMVTVTAAGTAMANIRLTKLP